MAIFRDVGELNRQNLRRKPASKTTGIRKLGLNVMGYNDDGTKNLWGKINPMNIAAPGLSHMYAEGLATGDTKDVLKENRSEAVGSQLASLKLASNAIPGMSTAGQIAMGFGFNTANKMNRKQEIDAAVETTEAMEKGGSALVEDMARKQTMEETGDALNEAVDNSTVMDDFESDSLDVGAEDYVSAPTDGVVGVGGKSAKKAARAARGAKIAKGIGTAANIASIAGDASNVIGSQNNYNKGLERAKRKQSKKRVYNNTSFNYL